MTQKQTISKKLTIIDFNLKPEARITAQQALDFMQTQTRAHGATFAN